MKKTINNLALLLALAVLGFCTSCKKLKDISFDYKAAAVTIDIPAYTSAGDFTKSNTVSSNEFKTLLSDKKVSLDNLKSVHIKTIHVELIDTATVPITFDVLDYMNGVFSASGLPQVQYASISHPTGTSVDLNPDQSVDLSEYLKSDSYSFGIQGHNNAPISHPTKLKVTATFEITAGIKK